MYEYLRDEIIELIGEEAYDVACELLARRSGTVTPLPHPAVRR